MWKTIVNSVAMLMIMIAITGLAYPLAMTSLAQVLFPSQANGSIISRDGSLVGSKLIGQNFTSPGYFHGRPSTAGPDGYDGTSSSGSNFGPTNQKLVDSVKQRLKNIRAENGLSEGQPVPGDLVLASGSGLDPHITPAAAYVQIERVAKVRGLADEEVRNVIESHIEGQQVSVLGEPRVNVLELNLALDGLKH